LCDLHGRSEGAAVSCVLQHWSNDMTQCELNRSVAKATGETVSEITRRGFVPLTEVPVERDPEDLILDWDLMQLERNVALFEQRETLAVA
jgi:hypothetical protein